LNLGINGRTALVLAGGSGLGRAIGLALAREGARVAVAGHRRSTVESAVQEMRALGATALAVEWDLSDLAAIEPNIRQIESLWGPVDILINNTPGPPRSTAAGVPADVWQRQFNLMVLSLIKTTDRVLPGMRNGRWGRIVTSTSSGVIAPLPELALSNVLRASLVSWSKTLAREVARDGITVNVIVPGRIATDRVRQLDEAAAAKSGRSVEEIAAQSAASIPIGRYGTPEEYAEVAAFLCSACASYVTGSVVRVDGGLLANI
jgi:3-oxoacyl-[acyl-carrier protein] reductase